MYGFCPYLQGLLWAVEPFFGASRWIWSTFRVLQWSSKGWWNRAWWRKRSFWGDWVQPIPCRRRVIIHPRPCKFPTWHGFLFYENGTVVWVMHVDDVEVGVVNSSCSTSQPHFIFPCLAFTVQGGFGNIKERVNKRALPRVFASQYYQRPVPKFALGSGFVQ